MSRTAFMTVIRRAAIVALPVALLACESPTETAPSPGPGPGPGGPVPAPAVARIDILGNLLGLDIDQTVELIATVRAADGTTLNVPVSWTTNDTTLAVITAAGVLTARAPGYTQVSAAAAGMVGTKTVQILTPVPAAAQLSPAAATAGDEGFTLTITGTGFVPGVHVLWNAQPRNAVRLSATEVQIELTAADLSTAGVASVLVVNPAPGGGLTSNLVTFTIEQSPVSWIAYRLDGQETDRILPAEVSRFDWIDDNGDRHAAVQRVLSGTLRIRSQTGTPTQWEHKVTIATYLAATGAEVRRSDLVWHGALMYDVFDGSYIFESYVVPGLLFRTRMIDEAAFVMYQSLDTRGEVMKPWVYVKQ